MQYTEKDLTEAARIIAYLRTVQRYAAALALVGILYAGVRSYASADSRELYLLAVFSGVLLIGVLSVIIRINHKTVIVYGFSCVVSGGLFLYSLFHYREATPAILTGAGLVAGILVIRHGVLLVFGNRAQDIFSRGNREKTAFVNNLIAGLKQSRPGDENVIHGTFTHDEKTRNMRIRFLEDVACFLLNGQRSPMFFDRENVAMFELGDEGDGVRVSVVADNHDWLEAGLRPDDFRKYTLWKGR